MNLCTPSSCLSCLPNFSKDEYKFELIGEGQDSFHVRRRGMQYFLDHTILPHNNSFGKKVAVGAKKYVANIYLETF